MYIIDSITSKCNYEENVVVSTFYVTNLDNEDEHFFKETPFDKSQEEIDKLKCTWSLTTLSHATEVSPGDLYKLLGDSFKRCYVRPLVVTIHYDRKNKAIVTSHAIEVSLTDTFEHCEHFNVFNESPLPESFLQKLEMESIVGYKPF